MKYMIASDIHGSAFYCEKMLDAFHAEKADKLILLGDLLYHGPRNDLPKCYDPKKVTKMLNELRDKILCVRGNCDSEVDQMVLEFPIMSDFGVIEVSNRNIYLTHGHNFNQNILPPLSNGDILIHGHTHVPAWVELTKNNYYLNPGSVSLPKEDSENSYMVIENNKISWKTLDYETYHELII